MSMTFFLRTSESYLVEGGLVRGTGARNLDRLSIRTINSTITVAGALELEWATSLVGDEQNTHQLDSFLQ